MRKYELTYLVSDQVQESDLNKVTGKVGGFITDLDGKVEKEEIWGRRKLAYPINKMEFANYVTLYFELPAEKVRELEIDLHQFNDVIRHLLIVKEYDVKTLTLTREEIAETAEIEKVIGGEKSFEAVEGMTKDSLDLMQKRQDDETAPTLRSESRHAIVGKESIDLMAKRGVEEEAEEQSDGGAEEKIDLEKEDTPIKEKKAEESKEIAKPKLKKAIKTKTVDEVIDTEEQGIGDKELETSDKAEETAEETEKPVKKTRKSAKKESTPDLSTELEAGESERLTELNKQIEDILSDEL